MKSAPSAICHGGPLALGFGVGRCELLERGVGDADGGNAEQLDVAAANQQAAERGAAELRSAAHQKWQSNRPVAVLTPEVYVTHKEFFAWEDVAPEIRE